MCERLDGTAAGALHFLSANGAVTRTVGKSYTPTFVDESKSYLGFSKKQASGTNCLPPECANQSPNAECPLHFSNPLFFAVV